MFAALLKILWHPWPRAARFLYIAPVPMPQCANTFLILAASRDPDAPKPYFEWLQNYAHIIYPLLILGVVVLVVSAVVTALRTQDLAGAVKAEVKRRVVVELRQQLQGTTAEALAKVVGLEPFRIVTLLEELQREGIVTSYTSSDRLTTWQIKGAMSRFR